MKATKKAIKLLKQMSEIQNMERGKICQMKGREHYNHQTWQNGSNKVRYVHRNDVQDLELAIQGYEKFMKLTQKYADEIIRQSKCIRNKNSKRRKTGPEST